MTFVLFWGCLLQLVVMLIFFWIDILPWFGFSSSINELGNGIVSAITCFFGGNGCTKTWYFGILFNVGYILGYIGSIGLNEDSANFNMICAMLVTPISVLYWVIFPSPGIEVPPWWSYTFSLILFFTGFNFMENLGSRSKIQTTYIK